MALAFTVLARPAFFLPPPRLAAALTLLTFLAVPAFFFCGAGLTVVDASAAARPVVTFFEPTTVTSDVMPAVVPLVIAPRPGAAFTGPATIGEDVAYGVGAAVLVLDVLGAGAAATLLLIDVTDGVGVNEMGVGVSPGSGETWVVLPPPGLVVVATTSSVPLPAP